MFRFLKNMLKISKNEELHYPPVNFSEANKLMEMQEDQIFQMKSLFDKNQTYYEQIEQLNNGNMPFARKRAELRVLNYRVTTVDMQNTPVRDKAKQIYDYCAEACKYLDDIGSEFAECEGKLGSLDNKLNNNATLYEKKIRELNELLDQLSDRRHKKIEKLESEEKRRAEEGLENEIKELENKLSILDDEQDELNRNNEVYENASKELAEKYDENKFAESEKRFSELKSEVSEIMPNLTTTKDTESELSQSTLTLEEYEAKLNEQLRESSRFWEDLERDPFDGFFQIEQAIGIIKAEIAERNEKYGEAKNSFDKCAELIKKQDEEIVETSSTVKQLASDLKETEEVYDDLGTSSYVSEKYDMMAKDLDKLRNEKENLNEAAVKTESEFEKMLAQLKIEKEKNDLEILANANKLMEIKKIEEDCAVMEASDTDLDQKVKQVENEVKKLKEIKNNLKDKETPIDTKQKEVKIAIEEAEVMFRILKTRREELKKQLGSATAPPSIYVKANDPNFTKSKNVLKKKTHHDIIVKQAVKRNWNSDSSMDAEEIVAAPFFKKKYRKEIKSPNKVHYDKDVRPVSEIQNIDKNLISSTPDHTRDPNRQHFFSENISPISLGRCSSQNNQLITNNENKNGNQKDALQKNSEDLSEGIDLNNNTSQGDQSQSQNRSNVELDPPDKCNGIRGVFSETTETKAEGAKRGRGRPKKPPPTHKRGRPRKH